MRVYDTYLHWCKLLAYGFLTAVLTALIHPDGKELFEKFLWPKAICYLYIGILIDALISKKIHFRSRFFSYEMREYFKDKEPKPYWTAVTVYSLGALFFSVFFFL